MDRKLVGAVLLLLASSGCRTCTNCCDNLPPVLDGPYSGTTGRAGSAFGGYVSEARVSEAPVDEAPVNEASDDEAPVDEVTFYEEAANEKPFSDREENDPTVEEESPVEILPDVDA